jgi:hypothetical protein
MMRRITGNHELSSLPYLLGGIVLFALPYLKISRYKELSFRLLMLASVLMFTVLFSSGSELVTYIIAFIGIGIWFFTLPKPISGINIFIGAFAVYAGSLFITDLFPNYIKVNFMKPYGLKVLPTLIVWLTVIYQMMFGAQADEVNPHFKLKHSEL